MLKHTCNIAIGLTTGFYTVHTATRFKDSEQVALVGIGAGITYYTIGLCSIPCSTDADKRRASLVYSAAYFVGIGVGAAVKIMTAQDEICATDDETCLAFNK